MGLVSPPRSFTDLFGFVVIIFPFIDMRADHAKSIAFESTSVRGSTERPTVETGGDILPDPCFDRRREEKTTSWYEDLRYPMQKGQLLVLA